MGEKPRKPDLPEIKDEPGMSERFQRGLQRALNTPPKHRVADKRGDRAIERGRDPKEK